MVRAARVALVAAAASTVLSACLPNRFVTGWVPYWGPNSGKAVIDNDDAAALMSEVSLMWYGTDDDATVDLMGSNTSLTSVVASIRAQGLPVIPTIFDSQPAGVMRGILHDPFARAAHEQHIVDLVTTKGYDGIDIDYEVFAFGDGSANWAAIKPDWILFVQELGGLLHQRGKVLSVTVPPVWVSGGVTRGYTVYAQQEIGPHVDRLRLMVYDWSLASPGPIAPMSWVNQVIDWSDSRVPNSRLQLGVPAYGRHWATKKNANETCPDGATFRDSITMKETAGLAAAHGQTPVRDASGELTFGWTQVVTGPRTAPIVPPTFPPPSTTIDTVAGPLATNGLEPALRLNPSGNVTCTLQHTVFVPDGASVRQRADAVLAAGWSGVAVWAFGYETADVYQALAGVAPVRPGGGPTGLLDAPVPIAGGLRVTGHAYHPEFDLPVAVTLTVAPAGGGAAIGSRTVTARTDRAGMPAGLGPFHGFDEIVPLAPGDYTVCAAMVLWGGVAGPSLGCQNATVSVPL